MFLIIFLTKTLLDDEIDRRFDDELIGRKVKVLYENGWFIGEIVYFNEKFAKYKVQFLDNTDYFIGCDEFGDVEIILLD